MNESRSKGTGQGPSSHASSPTTAAKVASTGSGAPVPASLQQVGLTVDGTVRQAAALVQDVALTLIKGTDGAFAGGASVHVDGPILSVVLQLKGETGTNFTVNVTMNGHTVTKRGSMSSDDVRQPYAIPVDAFKPAPSVA